MASVRLTPQIQIQFNIDFNFLGQTLIKLFTHNTPAFLFTIDSGLANIARHRRRKRKQTDKLKGIKKNGSSGRMCIKYYEESVWKMRTPTNNAKQINQLIIAAMPTMNGVLCICHRSITILLGLKCEIGAVQNRIET